MQTTNAGAIPQAVVVLANRPRVKIRALFAINSEAQTAIDEIPDLHFLL